MGSILESGFEQQYLWINIGIYIALISAITVAYLTYIKQMKLNTGMLSEIPERAR